MAQNDLINEIRATVAETVEAMQPARLMPGTVTQENPLKVQLDQKLEINAKSLIVPEHVEDLKKGNRVMILRDYGGTPYFILGRLK